MSETTVGNVQFGPGREPPRVPMGEMKDCTVIGEMRYCAWTMRHHAQLDIRLEHLEPWARAALERGVEVMRKEGPL